MQFRRSVTHGAGHFCYLCSRLHTRIRAYAPDTGPRFFIGCQHRMFGCGVAVHETPRQQVTNELERLRAALADSYAVERELGRGGMATVYLALDLRHDRQVALKVLNPELSIALGPDRFLREVKITARLNHPHILPLLDSGQADGFLFYVMPYVAGESLRDRLTREKQLPVDDALQIAREVADALSYAHSHNVIHRDVKPENLLLESGHAVVADFGIARAIRAAGGSSLTATGVAIGTPAYMSPEQAAGSEDLDGRSDLYSLACVLYEMLGGEPPFTGPTVNSIVHQHLVVEPQSIMALRPSVPGWVATALTRALAKTPADRFSPVALFAEALAGRDTTTMPTAAPAPAAHPSRSSWRLGLLGLAGVVAVGGSLLVLRSGREEPAPAEPTYGRTAIAVLPFQNLSAEGPHSYFASGLHDELLTQLSMVAALKVISRTSVMGYAGTRTPLRQIASELRVGSVVEGSVQVVGRRLRVNVQLIDAATDAHLWADRYDRTLDDAFAIQSDVAKNIVAAVGAALSSAESRGMTETPTANAEAYRLYLQGREYWIRPGRLQQDYEAAQQLYERALALDPDFALAHVALAEAHALMYLLRYDPSPVRLTRAIAEAEAAIRLDPDSPKAHEAAGMVYGIGRGDYPRALDAMLRAARGLPNDARLWQKIGFTRRVLGNWDDALAAFTKATELDPHDADLFLHRGITEDLTRRYADAVRTQERAQSLAPDLHAAAIAKGWTYARWRGKLDTLEAVLRRLPEAVTLGPLGDVAAQQATLHLWERNADQLLQVLRSARRPAYELELSFRPVVLYAAWAHQLHGDRGAARAAFDSARVLLDARLARLPDDWRARAARGLAMAGLGQRDSALREVRRLEQVEGYRDGYFGVQLAEDRARILAQIGEAQAALDEIERLLQRPSWLSGHTLRLDPIWDPIREHPRFRALLARYTEP